MRDFIYVKDVVKVNFLVVESRKVNGRVFNVVIGREIMIFEFVMKIIEIIGMISLVVFDKLRFGDIRYSRVDISEIRKLGFELEWFFEEGLKKIVEWYVKNNF